MTENYIEVIPQLAFLAEHATQSPICALSSTTDFMIIEIQKTDVGICFVVVK